MGTTARHVLVSGRVQGVAYRWSTAARARELGLSGWVRNLVDGRVEALLRGPEDAVASMLTWMHQGPPAAEVSGVVELEPADGEGVAPGFEILPTARAP